MRLGGGAALLSALVLAGCQEGNPNAPAKVTGRVTYNGSPVTGGSISFHYKDGAITTAAIDGSGNYSAADIQPGEVAVTVETESINPEKPTTEYRGTSAGGMSSKYGKSAPGGKMLPKGQGMSNSPAPGGTTSVLTYVKIPKKYADPTSSGLTYTIEKGTHSKDFALTD
jgi:hypothetical protein